MSAGPSEPDAASAVELPARLVFSLLKAAVRIAARVELPLTRFQDLVRSAYFLEYRRRFPRDLATVADKLGVSLRTAGTLNRSLTDDFFAPETRVEPVRQVTSALVGEPMDLPNLVVSTDLDEAEVRRAVKHLVEVGWVEARADGTYALSGSFRSYVAEDLARRVDAVNHQLTVIAESVWTRFVHGDDGAAAARTWAFLARPEDVQELIARTLAHLRSEAVALEEQALADGSGRRFAMTVAIAPRDEEET
ncbi:MAG: hypothetical protein H6732_04375 [Alphaproteobacteria bacterium]|nr:hypothetical protein [Alphaproteobacteria bacterium]